MKSTSLFSGQLLLHDQLDRVKGKQLGNVENMASEQIITVGHRPLADQNGFLAAQKRN